MSGAHPLSRSDATDVVNSLAGQFRDLFNTEDLDDDPESATIPLEQQDKRLILHSWLCQFADNALRQCKSEVTVTNSDNFFLLFVPFLPWKRLDRQFLSATASFNKALDLWPGDALDFWHEVERLKERQDSLNNENNFMHDATDDIELDSRPHLTSLLSSTIQSTPSTLRSIPATPDLDVFVKDRVLLPKELARQSPKSTPFQLVPDTPVKSPWHSPAYSCSMSPSNSPHKNTNFHNLPLDTLGLGLVGPSSLSEGDSLLGEVGSRFVQVKLIGAGSFGQVYRAFDLGRALLRSQHVHVSCVVSTPSTRLILHVLREMYMAFDPSLQQSRSNKNDICVICLVSGRFTRRTAVTTLAFDPEDGRYYAVKKSRRPFISMGERTRALGEVAAHVSLQTPGRPEASRASSNMPADQSYKFQRRYSLRDGGEAHKENQAWHPHCVHFFHHWEERGHLFLQTEYFHQGTLKDYLSQMRLNEQLIWQFLSDLVLGVHHIHSRRLVHLDLKPDNIFISSEGYLKIGDLGIATSVDGLDQQLVKDPFGQRHTRLANLEGGDNTYIAPELLVKSIGQPGVKSDIFSLGLIAYEMAGDVELPSSSGEHWDQLRHDAAPGLLKPGAVLQNFRPLRLPSRWMEAESALTREKGPCEHQLHQCEASRKPKLEDSTDAVSSLLSPTEDGQMEMDSSDEGSDSNSSVGSSSSNKPRARECGKHRRQPDSPGLSRDIKRCHLGSPTRARSSSSSSIGHSNNTHLLVIQVSPDRTPFSSNTTSGSNSLASSRSSTMILPPPLVPSLLPLSNSFRSPFSNGSIPSSPARPEVSPLPSPRKRPFSASVPCSPACNSSMSQTHSWASSFAHISRDLQTVIAAMLKRSPAERPSAHDLMTHPIIRFFIKEHGAHRPRRLRGMKRELGKVRSKVGAGCDRSVLANYQRSLGLSPHPSGRRPLMPLLSPVPTTSAPSCTSSSQSAHSLPRQVAPGVAGLAAPISSSTPMNIAARNNRASCMTEPVHLRRSSGLRGRDSQLALPNPKRLLFASDAAAMQSAAAPTGPDALGPRLSAAPSRLSARHSELLFAQPSVSLPHSISFQHDRPERNGVSPEHPHTTYSLPSSPHKPHRKRFARSREGSITFSSRLSRLSLDEDALRAALPGRSDSDGDGSNVVMHVASHVAQSASNSQHAQPHRNHSRRGERPGRERSVSELGTVSTISATTMADLPNAFSAGPMADMTNTYGARSSSGASPRNIECAFYDPIPSPEGKARTIVPVAPLNQGFVEPDLTNLADETDMSSPSKRSS
eukprot:g71561.t1